MEAQAEIAAYEEEMSSHGSSQLGMAEDTYRTQAGLVNGSGYPEDIGLINERNDLNQPEQAETAAFL
jgi:hypothetical protein